MDVQSDFLTDAFVRFTQGATPAELKYEFLGSWTTSSGEIKITLPDLAGLAAINLIANHNDLFVKELDHVNSAIMEIADHYKKYGSISQDEVTEICAEFGVKAL